jgi:MFS family permease
MRDADKHESFDQMIRVYLSPFILHPGALVSKVGTQLKRQVTLMSLAPAGIWVAIRLRQTERLRSIPTISQVKAHSWLNRCPGRSFDLYYSHQEESSMTEITAQTGITVEEKRPLLTRTTWEMLMLLGLAGQLAWAVENQFFNTFMYDHITPDPRAVSWMVAITAVVSTLSTIFMGTLSDRTRTRWGKRRIYMFVGYIVWGIITALFPAAATFQPVAMGIFIAILFDSILSFFAASASDGALSAYVTEVTTEANRGQVVGSLEIMKWIAFLVIYGGAGFIIQSVGYDWFFYIIGSITALIGLICVPFLKEEIETEKPEGGYWQQIASTFQFSSLRQNADFFKIMIALTLFMLGINVFFSYLMIYLQHYVQLSIVDSSIVVGICILVGGIGAAYPIGLLVDGWGRRPVAILSVFLEAIGLIVFSRSQTLPALIVSGILWLAPFAAWTIATTTWTRDLFPEEKRGQFAGYYVLFNVAFTMIPGSLLGGWLASTYGIATVLDGKPGYIPTPLLFQVAGAFVLLAVIPLLMIRNKKEAE